MVHGIGVLLFAAIGGYWLLERALAHKGQMKQLGLFLGSLIIVASLVGVAVQTWWMGSGHMHHEGMMDRMGQMDRMGGMDNMMEKRAGRRPMMPGREQESPRP